MSLLAHVLAALVYALAATATVVALPRLVPGTDQGVAVLAGAVVLLLFGLGHEVIARQSDMARQADEVMDLRASHAEVVRELGQSREEFARIRDVLAAHSSRKSAKSADVGKVASEVELLQSLVEQLSAEVADTRARIAAGPVAAVPPPVGERHSGGEDAPGAAAPDPAADEPRSIALVAGSLDDEAILQIIRDGLKRDRVDLVLQPIVSLPQRKRKYFEAFTRIRTDDGAIILPEQYIAIAEREGLITAIDNMLLFRCVQLLRRTQVRNRNLGFFCNISPYTLADRNFFGEFVEFMRENAELASDLIFEFSQATIGARDEDILAQLDRLSGLGFRFSMDQVASLGLDYDWLARQHFKFVKIEAQTLIREFAQPSGELDIHALDLKRTLERHGIDLIVEKIESEPMLLEVLDLQVDFGQGYLFGEPQFARSA